MNMYATRTPALAALAAIALASTALFAFLSEAESQGSRINPTDVMRPTATTPFADDAAKLLASGTARHDDASLSSVSGRSCNTCHKEADSYNATFKRPWPHFVASVKTKTGLDLISA